MDAKSFKAWLIQFQYLNERQREHVKQVVLDAGVPPDDACSLVNQRAQEILACPHCAATHLQRWGKESGIQRYRCGACHKTFNALTGTPLAHLKRRDAWLRYAQAMINGLSVRAAAREAGIHRTTSFRWRHRMLHQPAQEEDTELQNIVEADETYFLESFKGRGYRHYGALHLERLRFIRNCRALDMTHGEIRALLDLRDKPQECCSAVNHLLDEHIGHVDTRIAELQQLKQQLVLLRQQCQAEQATEACGILLGLSVMETEIRQARHTHLG